MRGGFYGLTKFIFLFYIVNGMFENDSNLSPDLMWLLQSNQIDNNALIEALVSNHYQQIYSEALSRLTYPEEAHRTAQNTLFLAVSRKKEFRGDMRVTEWLDAISAGIITERIMEIEKHSFLNPNLIKSIRTQQPDELLSNRQLKHAAKEIKSLLRDKLLFKSNWARFQVLGITCITILFVYILVTFSIKMTAGMPAGNTTSPIDNSRLIAADVDLPLSNRGLPISAKEVKERSIILPPLNPLSIDSSTQEIKQHIQFSNQLWNTMWADIVVNFFGPSGYIGPPFTERHQLWIDQDRDTFQIIGPTQGLPDYLAGIFLSPDPSPMHIESQGTKGYAKLGRQYPWFSIKSETVFLFPFAINQLLKTSNQDFLQDAELFVIGEDIVADRETVIVELTSPEGAISARLWLDTQIGIVLREQYYDPQINNRVMIESRIRKINFEDSFPTIRKNPENSPQAPREVIPEIFRVPNHYRSDLLDNPLKGFPFRNSPFNLELSQTRISIAKADRKELERTGTGTYHFFAESDFLGEVEMTNPLKLICDRSADGTRIVFSGWQILPTVINDKIYLLDLLNLDLIPLEIPDMVVLWIGFSPDNNSILVTGYDGLDGENGFYLIDTISRDYEQLPIRTGFGSVAWSPDNSKIAILDLSVSPESNSKRIRIFDVKTGEEERKFIFAKSLAGTANLEVPLDGWIANFQIPLQDLSQCTATE